MQEDADGGEKSKLLAAQLAAWDTRIAQIVAIEEIADEDTSLNLICDFKPEPDCDTTGYFWIANLLTRIEFEGLEIPFTYELGFQIGQQVFLPNGEILRTPKDYTVLWPEHEK